CASLYDYDGYYFDYW
nr:immunoglobulin heavy chain junction region [Mus musculus]MBK4184346.1 immunoglobulin heavy chain junction region [Mus musculus]